jgi:hypothetical protein
LRQISLTDPTSNWSFDPKQGPQIKDAKLSDTGKYLFEGSMNNFTAIEEFFLIVTGSLVGFQIQFV